MLPSIDHMHYRCLVHLEYFIAFPLEIYQKNFAWSSTATKDIVIVVNSQKDRTVRADTAVVARVPYNVETGSARTSCTTV